jgi:hypothetical protein
LLFSEVQRRAKGTALALSSDAAVGALARLGQQALPSLTATPRFIPRAKPARTRPAWLNRVLEHLTRQIVLAGAFAAVVLVLATALPAWAAIQQSESVATSSLVRSSAGVTGTAATRTEDLGVTTFVGQIPFVQQLRYFDAVAGTTPQAQRFVEGARQASVAGYLGEVGGQIAMDYLGNANATKLAIDTWAAAVAEAERQATAAAERRAAISAVAARPVWQAPSPIAGTRIPGASVTFYACVGNGFCGTMANGQQVFDGAAACSTDLPFGTRFVIASDPSSRIFTCLDRGALSPTWVDIWFYDVTQGYAWQSIVGTRSDIIIVE